jgi:hypothetical protein
MQPSTAQDHPHTQHACCSPTRTLRARHARQDFIKPQLHPLQWRTAAADSYHWQWLPGGTPVSSSSCCSLHCQPWCCCRPCHAKQVSQTSSHTAGCTVLWLPPCAAPAALLEPAPDYQLQATIDRRPPQHPCHAAVGTGACCSAGKLSKSTPHMSPRPCSQLWRVTKAALLP